MAAGLRVPLLSSSGLYRDDAWPALATRTGLGRALRLGVTVPGFELWARAWLGVSRSTAWAQLPVLVASVAAVAGAYLLARRVGCGPPAALVAGGMMAVSPVSVLYATRFKQYSFEAVGAEALLVSALWAAARPGSGRRWAGLVAVALAAGGFSAPLIGVGTVAVAWVGWASWRTGDPTARRAAAVAGGVFVVAVAAYARLVLGAVPPSLHRLWGDNYVDASSPVAFARTTWHVLDQFMAGAVYRHGPTGVLVLAAVAAGAAACRRRVAVLALGPVAVAVLLAAARRVPLGGGRIDEYLYPGLAVAAALAVQFVLGTGALRRLPPGLVGGIVAAGLMAFALTGGRTQVRENPYPGVDMAALRRAVVARAQPGDGVVVSPFSRYPWALVAPTRPAIAPSPRFATGFSVASTDPDVFLMPSEYVEDGYDPGVAVGFAADRRRVWYVATDTPASDTAPAVQAHEQDAERALGGAGWRVADRVEAPGGHADLLVRE
ncbi:MAG: hypothetical protein ABR511_03635 [Acidimicrobiales bacterium]